MERGKNKRSAPGPRQPRTSAAPATRRQDVDVDALLATPEGRAAAVAEMDQSIMALLARRGEFQSGDRGQDFMLDSPSSTDSRLVPYRVSGSAMAATGILHGDTVFVDPNGVPRPGDVVVVCCGGDAFEARSVADPTHPPTLAASNPPGGRAREDNMHVVGVARRLGRDL